MSDTNWTSAEWARHGDNLAALGEEHSAMLAYEAALRLDAACVAALVGRGVLSYRVGSWDKAIADFSLALRADENSVPARLNRANALLRRGDVERAAEEFTHVLELEPENWRAFEGRALVWSHLGKHLNAEHDERMAAELSNGE